MIPGEELYPGLKRLVSHQDWPVFEKLLDSREQELFDEFKVSPQEFLTAIQARAKEVAQIRQKVRSLIEEVEAAHKNKNRG